ncbi:MAG: T9SS type A sorting domain-containing protein [Prevotella sp.]|nr:T9SS type A sorting domain-containing protein [Prevotella sp.]
MKFYSKGKMYVQYKTAGTPAPVKGESSSTTLYIDGSAKFATGASIKQKGRTEITKDFINAKDPGQSATDAPQLFIGNDGNVEDDGVIAFVGKPVFNSTLGRQVATLQRIYGTNQDGATSSWDRSLQKKVNWINFPTISVEKGQPVTVSENAKTKYSDDWRKSGYLVVDTSAAISVDYLRADKYNRFAVNASYDNTNVALMNSGHARINHVHSKTAADPLVLAGYSQVNLELYKYSGTDDDGKFALDVASGRRVADPSTFGRTLRTGNTHPQGQGWNYLTGFSPPFEQLGADYMFYHTLTRPSGGSITSFEGPVVDPFFRMKAGRGYFFSMEVSPNDHPAGSPDNIDERWNFLGGNKGIFNERRARGGYVFNRSVYQDYLSVPQDRILSTETNRMDNFSRFLYDNTGGIFDAATKLPVSASYNVYGEANRPLKGLNLPQWIENGKDRSRYELMDQEKFNVGSVTVDLEPGLNFLGNPFMAPISLNPLLGYEAKPDAGGVYRKLAGATSEAVVRNGFESDLFTPSGASVKILISSASPNADLRAKYWLINQALVKYDATQNIYRYKTTYDYVSRDGTGASNVVSGHQPGRNPAGPGIPGDGDSEVAAKWNPLTHVVAPMQMFCLQASRAVTIKIDSALQVFGVSRFPKSAVAAKASASAGNADVMRDWFIVEARSNNGFTADRATVIFNENAKIQYKQDPYDTRKGVSEEFETYKDVINGKATKTSFEQSRAIVYTRSSDRENLLGNAVPARTKELALFFLSPSVTQEMTLRFYNLDNLESVPGVWLIDRYLNKTIKVAPETEYTFVSEAASDVKNEIDDNRFILRFYDTGYDTAGEQKISCYYNSSTLYIYGLIDDDINSDVVIYDMQGRLMGQTKITGILNPWTYVKPLNTGAYIVKITGKKNHISKFVNLQN